MGETLDKRIKDHNKKGRKEKKGRTVGVELLNGEKIFGTLENSRTNILLIRDFKDNRIKDVHRAIIKRFLILIQGGQQPDSSTCGVCTRAVKAPTQA